MARVLLITMMAAAAALPGCRQGGQPSEKSCRRPGLKRTARFVEQNLPRARQLMDKTLAYFDRFAIDPLALRRQGIKGRKKLVELFDGYVALHRHAPEKEKAAIKERFRLAARVTGGAGYHDMGKVDDTQFKQDATSYLRACYLMEKMGLPADAYRREIAAVKKRLDAHMSRRGPHQRMAFRFYYQHFGLAPPEELSKPFAESITAGRVNPYLLDLNQAYDLTHEVFVPYDYGGKLKTDYFSDADHQYLRRALEILATIYLHQRNIDILGELLASLRYTGNSDLAIYRDGLSLLLAAQRPNGSFGDYEQHREKRGDLLELDLYLHTTSVAMDILPLAFLGPPQEEP